MCTVCVCTVYWLVCGDIFFIFGQVLCVYVLLGLWQHILEGLVGLSVCVDWWQLVCFILLFDPDSSSLFFR